MFEDIPVDVIVIYEGERIRCYAMQVELGGERIDIKFERVGSQEPYWTLRS